MKIRAWGPIAAVFLLGACSVDGTGQPVEQQPVPEEVIALAGPGQDIQTARLRPEDGCYWYLHSGPVETTLLPLRTADGGVICASSEEAAAT